MGPPAAASDGEPAATPPVGCPDPELGGKKIGAVLTGFVGSFAVARGSWPRRRQLRNRELRPARP